MCDFLVDTPWVSLFWIAFALVCAIVALLSFPPLRRRFMVACSLLGVVATIWLGIGRISDYRVQAAIAESEVRRASLVKPSDLEFLEFRMGPVYSSWSLSGRIKNKSRYTVSSIKIKLLLRDCEGVECEVVGEERPSLLPKDLPPGQVRDIDSSGNFDNIKIRGHFEWGYEVLSISAIDDSAH